MSFQEVDPQTQSDQIEEGDVHHAPFAYYTYALMGMIATVFVVQFLTSSDTEFFQHDRYSAFFAGFDKQAFINGNEYWRLLTGVFIHSGVLHVAMNSYALYSFGRLVETLSNGAQVAIVFLLSAIGGDVLSFIFSPESTSVGASGGIVGLLSYLAVYAFRRRKFISPEFRRSLLVNIGFILVFGLVLYNKIDNWGHIGGLIAGALYGLIQIPTNDFVDPRETSALSRIFAIAAMFICFLASVTAIVLLVNGRAI